MAENKRQSVAASSKAATPKTTELNDQGVTLSKAIGARVKVQTSLHNLEGTLFTADPMTHVVAINTAPAASNPQGFSAQPGDYHIIPIAHIQSFSVVSPAAGVEGSGFDAALPSLSKLDLDSLKAREEAAVRKLKDKEANRNKGATKEGQEIYDNFARLLPTRWHENNIIVNDNVIIKPPYLLDNCAANKGDQSSLQHVRKILEGYYAKKKVAQGGSAQRPGVATPIPPRKGG